MTNTTYNKLKQAIFPILCVILFIFITIFPPDDIGDRLCNSYRVPNLEGTVDFYGSSCYKGITSIQLVEESETWYGSKTYYGFFVRSKNPENADTLYKYLKDGDYMRRKDDTLIVTRNSIETKWAIDTMCFLLNNCDK